MGYNVYYLLVYWGNNTIWVGTVNFSVRIGS